VPSVQRLAVHVGEALDELEAVFVHGETQGTKAAARRKAPARARRAAAPRKRKTAARKSARR
jgi:hypothetical protein